MAIDVAEATEIVPPTPATPTIADIVNGEDGDYSIEGAWVVATYARGCLLTDNSGAYILAYQPDVTPSASAVVNISGSVTTYGGLKQFAAGAAITVTGETHSVTHPTAEVMDGAKLDAYLTAPVVKYVEYEGTLAVNGNYMNVNISGAATAIGSIQYPSDDLKAELTALNGKLIKVTGYLIGVASSKYANTMAVSVVESENVAPEVPEVTIAEVIAGGSGSYTVNNAWVVATYARGCLLTDNSGAHILAFSPSVTPAVGAVVSISGNVSMYGGLPQFGSGAIITETGKTVSVVHPTPEVMDGAKLDAYLTAPVVKYVEYEGTLAVNGSYYNITIDGASTAVGSAQYPSDDIKTQLAALNGKAIKVTGYLIGVSSSKYTNTMVVSVSEAGTNSTAESNGTENFTPENEQNPGWN